LPSSGRQFAAELGSPSIQAQMTLELPEADKKIVSL
jgi:hypothetical protein